MAAYNKKTHFVQFQIRQIKYKYINTYKTNQKQEKHRGAYQATILYIKQVKKNSEYLSCIKHILWLCYSFLDFLPQNNRKLMIFSKGEIWQHNLHSLWRLQKMFEITGCLDAGLKCDIKSKLGNQNPELWPQVVSCIYQANYKQKQLHRSSFNYTFRN